MVWCCNSWYFLLVVAFLQSCEISGVVSVVVFGGVAVWYGITKAVKKIKSGILVVSVGERMRAVDNACRDGERDEVTLFDVASCKEVQEPIGTSEVTYPNESYSGFCTGLRGFFVGRIFRVPRRMRQIRFCSVS